MAWGMIFYLAEHQPREPRQLSNAETERQPSDDQSKPTNAASAAPSFRASLALTHLTLAKK